MRFATGWRSLAGRSGTRPRAPSWCPRARWRRSDHLRQQPVEEAERGRRRVHRVWRAPETSAGGAGAALRLAGPPGGRRRGRSLSRMRIRNALLRTRGRADRRARSGSGPAQPRRGLPFGRVRRRRWASSSPNAARPRSPRSTCKASAGAVEHLADRPRPQPGRLARGGEGGRLLDLGRRRGRRPGPLGRRPDRPDRARPRRRGQGNPPPRRFRLRRTGRVASRARSSRSTSLQLPRRCSSRLSASALGPLRSERVAPATALARNAIWG